MSKSNYNVNNENEFDYKEYLESINNDLEIIKKEYADPLDGILKYNKQGVCTTFFGDIKNNISIEDINIKEEKISEVIKKFDLIKENLSKKDGIPINLKEVYIKSLENLSKKDGIPINLKEVYIKSLENLSKKFLMFKSALWMEGEKSGYTLSNYKRKEYSDAVLNLQREIYGERVTDNPKEVNPILDTLHELFEKKKSKLKDDEVSIFENFLEESDLKLGFDDINNEIKQSVNKKDLVGEAELTNIDQDKTPKAEDKTPKPGEKSVEKSEISTEDLRYQTAKQKGIGNTQAFFKEAVGNRPKGTIIVNEKKYSIKIRDKTTEIKGSDQKILTNDQKIDLYKQYQKQKITEYIQNKQNPKNIDKDTLKIISQNIVNFYKDYFGEENTDLKSWNIVEQSDIDSLNISGMKKEFGIPETYENISSKKITQVVMSHEIEQHLLSRDNTNRILGKGFTSGRYDFISEGVAKLNEDIALGKINSIEDLKKLKEKPAIGIIGVFICENYNYEDAVKIIKIYNTLSSTDDDEKCQKKAEDIVKRRKRFVSYNLPGSSIKDTLYQRGKNWVIDYLTEDGSLETAVKRYKDLNTFKFGPEELKYIEDIKKEIDVKDENLIYTLFIGRILHDKLNKGKGSANKYLSEMKLNTKEIDFTTKRKLIHILNQIR